MPAESQRMSAIAGQLWAMPANLTVPGGMLMNRHSTQSDHGFAMFQ